MLELVGVVVRDGGVTRLNRCAFHVRRGEVLALLGPTGSGKSTALEVAAGLRRPERGRVLLEGRDVTRQPRRLRQTVGYLGHDLPGPHELSGQRWLELWSDLDKVPGDLVRTRMEEIRDRFDLGSRLARPVAHLSRGERRRLGLARLWIRQPEIYLLDGPEEGVDGAGLRQFASALRSASAAGATVLFAASAPFFPPTVCDRVVALIDGAAVDDVARGAPDFAARVAHALGWQT